jgi:hypothetical protein
MVAIHEPKESKTLSVRQAQEIVVRRKNDIGILFELSSLVSESGVNILAVNGAVCGEDCVIRLVTDDNRKTKNILTEHRFKPQEESVVLVELPNRPGSLKRLSMQLAEGSIDIRHIYAATTQDHDKCLVVFESSRDEEAVARLKDVDVD